MRSVLALTAVAALTLAACGSDSDSGADTTAASETTDAPAATTAPDTTDAPATTAAPQTTEAPATTTAPATTEAPSTTAAEETTTQDPANTVSAADLAAPGPFPVGVTTRALPEGNPVEIWYPATEDALGGVDAYRVRDFLPPAIAELIPADVNDSRSIDATRDATAAADGPFPVVLFSHGASSFRLQSSVLAQHLASWGMVVASTDHPSRDLLNQFSGTSEGQPPSVDDFRSLRSYLTTLDDDPLVGGALDNDRVALGGHSAGGGTVVQMAGDPGILGYVSYASGLGDEAPDVPSLFMAGELDAIVSPTERTVPAFERAPAPSWLWSFAESGHLAFSDLCAVGDGNATLIDLAEAAGLGAVIDDRLRTLGTDGCEDPNRPVEEVWPGIHQATTGFYRWVFGIDEAPIGLDASAVTDGVTVTQKLTAQE